MEGGPDDHLDPPSAEPVVETQHPIGTRHGDGYQRHTGTHCQPGSSRPELALSEAPNPGPFGENCHDSATTEMRQGLSHRSKRHGSPAHRDDLEPIQSPVEETMMPGQVDEGDEPGTLAEDCTDQWGVEERMVIGGYHERGLGKPITPFDGQSPHRPR